MTIKFQWARLMLIAVFSIALVGACTPPPVGGGGAGGGDNGGGDNGGDTGGGDTGGGDTGGGDTGGGDTGGDDTGGDDTAKAAIVKTDIIISNGGKIDVGDDLIVYGVGSDEDETRPLSRFNQPAGVHYFKPSEADSETTGGTMITGSDVLFGHRDFKVAGTKIALVRSTNAVSIYDTATGGLFDISPTEITLHPLQTDQAGQGHMTSDESLIATINNDGFHGGTAVSDGNQIKVIDVSGSEPVIISLVDPLDIEGSGIFDQAVVDAASRQVVALANSDLFLWNLDDPTAPPTKFDFDLNTDSGLVSNDTSIHFDGTYVIYHDEGDLDLQVTLMDVTDGSIMRFNDNPSLGGPLSLENGSFAYALSRENADTGDEFNSRRSAIGSTDDAPAATLANQLDRYPFRPTTVDLTSSAGPTFTQEDCLTNQKLIGYGATVCITPDGTRTFLGGWRTLDTNYDYIQMSTGGVFTDFADPEGSSVTGSLMGVDVACSADVVAFRGLRQVRDTGCITTDDWMISFIRIDELD